MTKSTITREQLLEIIETDHVQCGEASYLARMELAAMDQKPALHRYRRKAVEPYGPYPWHYEVFVDYPQPFEDIEDEYFYAAPPVVTGFAVDGESECLPLDYLQGHKDGLEWAAQLAEANHPETGDWLYDDPIELAKAIRKGPYMPPVQPAADSEQVAEITEDLGRLFVKIHYPTTLRAGDKLYLHAQPAPVVEREPIAWLNDAYLARGVVDGEAGSEDAGPGYIPVYREAGPQPAPVVPDVMEPTIEAIKRILPTSNPDEYAACIGADMWNACRAAMFEAAPQSPGSEPATVPGKWIPVSERMPEVGDIVLTAMGGVVNVGEMECSAANCRFFTSVISGRELPATHWMQLPAGPQEVKGE